MSRILPATWRPALTALSLLWMATVAGAVMVFLAQTLLARRFGAADYGLFASSLATITLVAPLAGFGLSQFRLKAFGSEGWGARRWRRASDRFMASSTLLAVVGVVAWARWGPPVDAATRHLLMVLAPLIPGLLAIEQIGSKLRLEERYAALAGWQLLMPAGRVLVAALAVAWAAMSVDAVAYGYSLIAVAAVVLAWPQWRAMARDDWRLRGHGRLVAGGDALDWPTLGTLWRQAWPYGMAAVLYPVFFQIGTVLLKYLAGDAQAGRFGIALAVMTAIYLFPATVYQKFLLSKLHRWAVHDRPRFRQVYRWGCTAMLACGVLVGVALALSAGLATRIFGADYRSVVPLLQLLAVCVPLRFLSTAVGSVLLTEGHMRYRVWAMASCALAAVALNLLLIPAFAEMGAAIATVIAEALLLGSLYRGARRVDALELD